MLKKTLTCMMRLTVSRIAYEITIIRARCVVLFVIKR
jgi:hypothetical protein